MKIQSKNIIGLVLLGFIVMGAGCATTHKTTTTQTTVQTSDQGAAVVPDQPSSTVVAKSTTTTTNAEAKPRQTGIIGGLFHIIGSIIAFPFLVIGNVLQAIF